ncbi:hypothetical protein GPECTOR_132g600 [Gonium pectorale]|uniref:F-box domain-containing protein n=1 Tax=Gonium pectorale TaxID=33097 RepID=A0A150FYB8_GONPE|nr:hypothetical protein GPECTOR_132g600 [Gonium pectorale]|eukprot:KXZ42588.1 hypothetical protein GPECTOR_132g600 [Gonium pectorale]
MSGDTEMTGDQSLPAPMALDELPDEVLLRVLAGAGTKGILRAAACCRRLRSLSIVLRSYRCFSAAASTKPELSEALAEACDRALQGMLGCVDFVLLFVANHEVARGSLAAAVVEGLRGQLPPGTCVVGCATAGLMGVGPGGPFELDPGDEAGVGVGVLLGRMPGCTVAPFCNLPPAPAAAAAPPKRGSGGAKAGGPPAATLAANAAVLSWLTGAGPAPNDMATNAAAASTAAAAAEVLSPDEKAASGSTGGGSGSGSGPGPGSSSVSAAPAGSPSAAALGLQSAWLLQAGSNTAFKLLSGPGGLLRWMQADKRVRAGAGA